MKVMTCSWFDFERLNAAREKGSRIVSISRSEPRGFIPDFKIWDFCPSHELLSRFKSGKTDQVDYDIEYIRDFQLTGKDGIPQLEDGDVLCCWEGEGEFCHRTILAELLTKQGIEVEVH